MLDIQDVPLIYVFLHMLYIQKDLFFPALWGLLQLQPKEKPNICMTTVFLFSYFAPGKLVIPRIQSPLFVYEVEVNFL